MILDELADSKRSSGPLELDVDSDGSWLAQHRSRDDVINFMNVEFNRFTKA